MQTLQASCEDPRRFFTLFPTTSVSFFSHITSNELLLSDGLNKLLMQDFMLMYSLGKHDRPCYNSSSLHNAV